MTHAVPLIAWALWVRDRDVQDETTLSERLVDAPRVGDARPPLAIDPTFGPSRIPRADRATQLAAYVASAAVARAGASHKDTLGVITASVLASMDTNARFERRRRAGRSPEPRSFPYTAPNAVAGELSMALGARGPVEALVGGREVGAVALARAAAWLRSGDASRVVVVAFECPGLDVEAAEPLDGVPVECACAMVLDARRTTPVDGPSVSAAWAAPTDGRQSSAENEDAMLAPFDMASPQRLGAVAPLARAVLAVASGRNAAFIVSADAGAPLKIDVRAG